jgi:hypothetical protein
MTSTNNYRNVKFFYKEWQTYTGAKATGYTCNDKSLLKHVNTVSFGAKTIQDMKSKIDDYLDNVERHIELKELNDKACAEFYAIPTLYRGD